MGNERIEKREKWRKERRAEKEKGRKLRGERTKDKRKGT